MVEESELDTPGARTAGHGAVADAATYADAVLDGCFQRQTQWPDSHNNPRILEWNSMFDTVV